MSDEITPLPGGHSFHIPGIGTITVMNTYTIDPPTYSYGVEFAGEEGFSFLGESEGSKDGLRSTITVQTPLGTVTNTQSYGTQYAGEIALIRNAFEVVGPSLLGSPQIVEAQTDINLNGLPEVSLVTPFSNFVFPPGDVPPPPQ